MGSEKEGKENDRGAVMYKKFSLFGGGTVSLCLFADVGPSVPRGETIIRQHEQRD